MKKLIKCVALVLAFLVCSVAMQAKDLKVNFNDGRHATFALADRPEVSFSGSDMIVSSPSGSFTYSRSDVGSWTFSETNAVGDIAADGLRISLNDRLLSVSDNKPVSGIAVYDLSGKSCSAAVKYAENSALVDLEGLQPGIYLISIKDYPTLKISVK